MASTQEILRLVERFSALGQFRGLPLAQAPPKGRANPDKSCAAQDQKRADSVSHAIAGTQSAMMRPRTQICQDTCTPAALRRNLAGAYNGELVRGWRDYLGIVFEDVG